MSHDGSQNVVLIRILFPLDGLPHFWKANGSLIFLAVRKPLEANNQHTKIQQKKQHTQKKNYQLHSRMQTLTRPAKKKKKKQKKKNTITGAKPQQSSSSRLLYGNSTDIPDP
jgi:activator of 2-hydroxyglutaryl-CoA dehydratase